MKTLAITLGQKITRTRLEENPIQIQIIILLTQEVPEMKILRPAEVQMQPAEAVRQNHLLQVHQQEAIQEEINKTFRFKQFE